MGRDEVMNQWGASLWKTNHMYQMFAGHTCDVQEKR